LQQNLSLITRFSDISHCSYTKIAMVNVVIGGILVSAIAIVSSVLCQELPVGYNVRSVRGAAAGTGEQCPATQTVRESIKQDLRSLINSTILPALSTQNQTQVVNTTGRACGCGGPGWRRVAYLNMSDPAQVCPSAWELITTPRRSCGRPSSAGAQSCFSAVFPAQNIQYNQVCGRIIGYQYGQPEAFVAGNIGNPQTIDDAYVDGISLTYGNPRQHIWSFAAALDERSGLRAAGDANYGAQCECTDSTDAAMLDVPSYVGNDYFCETGVPTGQTFDSSTFYAADPLWDGRDCGPTSSCCTFNNPPWFCKQLSQLTNADLEVRLCSYNSAAIENTPVQLVEIYTQ
jgi:hypothetical protein